MSIINLKVFYRLKINFFQKSINIHEKSMSLKKYARNPGISKKYAKYAF